jgi:hypothetical protein
MTKFVGIHGKTPCPEELVGAADYALTSVFRSSPFNESKAHVYFLQVLEAAYNAVVLDPILRPKYEQLLTLTVKNLPKLLRGRFSPEEVKEEYRVTYRTPMEILWAANFGGEKAFEKDQDRLYLLKKVVSPE